MKCRIHENPVVRNQVEFKELCEETKGTRTVAEITVYPGGGIPIHFHREFTEYYECLQGQLHMTVGKHERVLRPGEYVMVPLNTLHRYYNPTNEPVKFKVVIQPGNIGFQLLVVVLNGLARDGKVTRTGLPKNLFIFGYLSVAAGSNVPGIISLFQPVLNWLHNLAVKKGIDKMLLQKYYK